MEPTQPVKYRQDELEEIIAKARRFKEAGYWIEVQRHGRRTKVLARKSGEKATFLGSTSRAVKEVKMVLADEGLMRPRKL